MPTIPDTHFVDAEGRPAPLVVRQDDGMPEWAIVDGRLVPYADHRPASQAPPAPPLTLRAEGGGLSLGLLVS